MESDTLLSILREITSKHPIGVANKMAFLNSYCDADYVAVTTSGQIYEYEIKVSRNDYLRDRQKTRHKIYSDERPGKKPNRFWYTTAPGIVRDDLPKWAGWLEWHEGKLIERVQAPVMWRGTHEIKTILQLAGAMRRRSQ